MIRKVTYYQAVCDSCGCVNDGDDYYSAWSDALSAEEVALESDWNLVYSPNTTVLLCLDCKGRAISCEECEADLDDCRWQLVDGTIYQRCTECGRRNQITLKETE